MISLLRRCRTAAGRLRDWGRAAPKADDALGAAAVFTRGQRWALLACFALLVILRIPKAWVHGRFMGEEGTIFFAYAWHRPAALALWRVFGGYLNLGANATTLAAARLVQGGWLPLEAAPRVTMAAALLVQVVPALLILTARGRWLANRWTVLAALLALAITPRTEEVFANVLHIQFHLALAAALVLALDVPASVRARIAVCIPLLLAPLCGPGAMVLLPFFAVRALLERDRARLAQTAALGLGCAIQLLLFFAGSSVRGRLLDPVTLLAVLAVRLIAMSLLTVGRARRLGGVVHASYLTGGVGLWLCAAAGLAAFATLILLAWRRRRDPALWLIVPGLAIAAASFGGGSIDSAPREWFSPGAAQRYNFLPLVLLTLGLLALARRGEGRVSRWCAALCAISLASGALAYPDPIRELSEGPSWPREVAGWRVDHDHPLATWPARWTVDLSDRDRPCAAGRVADADLREPSYCESAWEARVRRAIAADIKREG